MVKHIEAYTYTHVAQLNTLLSATVIYDVIIIVRYMRDRERVCRGNHQSHVIISACTANPIRDKENHKL